MVSISSISDDEEERQMDLENSSTSFKTDNIIKITGKEPFEITSKTILTYRTENNSKIESTNSASFNFFDSNRDLSKNSTFSSQELAVRSTPERVSSKERKHCCSSQGTFRWSRGYQCRWAKIKQMVILATCFLSIFSISVAQGKIRSRDPGDPVGNIRHVLPELELGNNSVTDVRFNVGSTAFLPCRFPSFPRHHENRVSWVRRWDWHILTAGLFTYTNDDRFVVLHRDGTNDWTLQIKFLDTQDNGTYECQVHSGSGFMSQFVNLHVVTPKAVILESKELTVKNGDNFALTCIIQQSLEPPVYVIWLHGGVTVNYAADRPRLTVQMEAKGSTTRSLLRIRDAKYTDSGNYTCTAPNAINAWVLVYVTEGDTVAAVQNRHPDASGAASSPSSSAAAGSSSSSASSSSSSSSSASSPTLASGANGLVNSPHNAGVNLLLSAFLSIFLQLFLLQSLNGRHSHEGDACNQHSDKQSIRETNIKYTPKETIDRPATKLFLSSMYNSDGLGEGHISCSNHVIR